MAEEPLTSLASRVLDVITSEAIMTAHVRARSTWVTNEELKSLSLNIEEIRTWLPDAERKQDESFFISVFINRVRDALYDAEELFDLVASDGLFKQQIKENKQFGGEVRDFFSKLFPVNSTSEIAKKLKAVKENLDGIYKCGTPIKFELYKIENQRRVYESRPRETHPCLAPEDVIGREHDKNAILELLFDKSLDGRRSSVIAIAGIEGIGKTALAQIVYKDDNVLKHFGSRWWVSIAGLSDQKAILGRMFETITENFYDNNYTVSQLCSAIVRWTKNVKYILVLDDVWDCTASLLLDTMPLLRNNALGSKIIITTPSMSSVKAMHVEKKQIYQLRGLREEASWKLFKKLAFRSHEECTPNQTRLGGRIIKECDGAPLAIANMACLLRYKRPTEWEIYEDQTKLFKSLMPTLRLSLPSTSKECLAYCSLFPNDYVFQKEELTYLWIGQGFVMPKAGDPLLVEDIAYRYLMELLDNFVLQDAKVDENGEVFSWMMNSVFCNWVRYVARSESIMVRKPFDHIPKKIRHLSIGYELDESWNIPPLLYDMDRPLHSLLFLYEGSLSPLVLSEVLTKFKLLRALSLQHQTIEVVPSSIGELKLLRYLNLSHNRFPSLPSSITMLVNLLTLDISWCEQLELFPDEFRRLCNLRHLDTKGCYRLRHRPPGLEELASLQRLSLFKVGRVMDTSNSKPDVLAALDLKGELEIKFDEDMKWGKNESLDVPLNLRVLTINNYPGMRLSYLKTISVSSMPTLASLHIGRSSKIKHLSLFGGLPSLKSLQLSYLEQLEYIEIEEGEATTVENALFFPCLEDLKLEGLPKLKGWSRKVEAAFTSHGKVTDCLPVLAHLTTRCCKKLQFMPLCPLLATLELNEVNNELIQHLLQPSFSSSSSSMPSFSLETVEIRGCDLLSFPLGTLTSLCCLRLSYCYELKKLSQLILHLNALKELVIDSCPKLELWGEEKRGIDWDLLPKLSKLTLIGMPSPHELPGCLQQRQAHGKLIIKMDKYKSTSNLSVHPLINKGPLLTTYRRPAKA